MTERDLSTLGYLDENTLGSAGVPFTGTAVAHYANGNRKMESTYIDGIPNGLTREWYEDGQLRLEAILLGEADNGIAREWYPSGLSKREAVCELGVCLRSITWDENGNLASSYTLSANDPAWQLLRLNRTTVSLVAAPAPHPSPLPGVPGRGSKEC